MALGGITVRPRAAFGGESLQGEPALAVVPNALVLPHFDRMLGRWPEALPQTREAAPPDIVVAGIDEDTALLRLTPDAPWQITGRQTVSIARANAPVEVLRVGARVTL
jgi:hypothetical protein